MKIVLRIVGKHLFEKIAKEIAAFNSAFPRRLGRAKLLSWHLESLEPPFRIGYLSETTHWVAVVLVDARYPASVEEFWQFTGREYLTLCHHEHSSQPLAPVILVFDDRLPANGPIEMPPLVADWVNSADGTHEIVRRVLACLRHLPHVQDELGDTHLILHAGARRLGYGNDSVQLSPAEVPLAEMFLSHFGSVVPLREIQLMFRLSGRSTASSNIRVTIYQLRFKIELLTRRKLTLACAYGEGYVLRPNSERDAEPQDFEARQRPVAYAV